MCAHRAKTCFCAHRHVRMSLQTQVMPRCGIHKGPVSEYSDNKFNVTWVITKKLLHFIGMPNTNMFIQIDPYLCYSSTNMEKQQSVSHSHLCVSCEVNQWILIWNLLPEHSFEKVHKRSSLHLLTLICIYGKAVISLALFECLTRQIN